MDGVFERMKAKYVAGGNETVDNSLGDTHSSTVNIISVMNIINLAAIEKCKLRVYDIKGAYLIPDIMPNKKAIYIRCCRDISGRYAEILPELKKYLDNAGRIIFKLRKYLYGLPQTAKMFNDYLTTAMIEMGFEVFSGDRCVFTRGRNAAARIRVRAWVDDIICSGTDASLDIFKAELEKRAEITEQKGDKISLFGMDIRAEGGGDVTVSQKGAREDLLLKFDRDIMKTKHITTSCTDNILDRDENDKDLCDRKKYLLLLMSSMYLARIKEADILFACSALATFHEPTKKEYAKLCRVLSYLYHSGNLGIIYRSNGQMIFKVLCDASHASHEDGKGHGGMILSLGSGYVFAKTGKLKTVTLSSTDSEGI